MSVTLANVACPTCYRVATHVDIEADDVTCLPCAKADLSADWRRDYVRRLSARKLADLVKAGKVYPVPAALIA